MDVPPLDLPVAPGWALQTGSLGSTLVWVSVALFLASVLGWFLAPWVSWGRRVGIVGLWAGTVAVLGVFGSLAALFIGDQFEYAYVYGHADKLNTIPYKIAGIWSGQEGSFLLWATTAALVASLIATGTGQYRRWFTITCSLFLATLMGMLAFESPFVLNLFGGKPYIPEDGVGLAPALQNYWVIIHPPTIFLGFGSLLALFAYGVAAMATGDLADWTKRIRPWAILSLSFLGLGLAMGGLWAYETLGWGGFWMWDPVENTSFVPWAILAIFVHGVLVQITKGKWIVSNLLLAGLPFIAFLYGTFLTRSGFLGDTSVHSFAQMNNTALWMLIGGGGGFTLGYLVLWAWRWRRLRAAEGGEPTTSGMHREAAYRWGSVLLACLAIATAVGMSVPLIQSLSGSQPKVVEEWLYHRVLVWFFVPTMILMALGPLISWRGTGFKELWEKLYAVICITVSAAGFLFLAMVLTGRGRIDLSGKIDMPFGTAMSAPVWTLILAGVCLMAVVSNVWRMFESTRGMKMSMSVFLSHIGVAITLAGLMVSRGLENKVELTIQEGAPQNALGYQVAVKEHTSELTDRKNKVLFDVTSEQHSFVARPGFYYANMGGEFRPMVWPHIQRGFVNDIYFTLHPMQFNASEVTPLTPNQSANFEGYRFTFKGIETEGEAGSTDTVFRARLTVATAAHSFDILPGVKLTETGTKPEPAVLDSDYFVTLESVDPRSGAASIQLQFVRPLYFVELFYKPMTGLVWLGIGIMGIGGIMAAWYRRYRPARTLPGQPAGIPEEASEVSEKEDALVATP
ncbi:MAG: hypothetical protein DCC46_02635 [Armatimonadetes bacterium]|nr:MAG: hypothetical protein DCC46_02635 [Armatimonadota bacterium]